MKRKKKLLPDKTPFELIVYQLKKTQILKRVKGKYEKEHEKKRTHRNTSTHKQPATFLDLASRPLQSQYRRNQINNEENYTTVVFDSYPLRACCQF